MEADGHKVAALHGAYEGSERDRIIDDFRAGKAKVLITTNVLARGIDVATVSMVVNYDLPLTQAGRADPETYLHRIGRTGRFGRVGVSISFVHDKRSWQELAEIQQHFGVEMTRVPTDDMDEGKFLLHPSRCIDANAISKSKKSSRMQSKTRRICNESLSVGTRGSNDFSIWLIFGFQRICREHPSTQRRHSF